MELEIYEKEHSELVRKLSAECTVLLKKDGAFPLEKPGKLALYGSGARRTRKGGTGSGEVNSHYFVTAEEGLRKAGFIITTEAWLEAYDYRVKEARKAFVKEIKARARAKHTMAALEGMGAVMPEPEYDIDYRGTGDTAVYILSRVCGEGSDRSPVKGDVLLTDTEVRDILDLNRRYARFMLVLNVGGPVDLTPVMEAKNILVLSQLGAETGNILADLLLGKSVPSGRLTSTWAAWEDVPQIGDFGEVNDTRYREGVFVGYRYYDSTGKKPLFSFGFGLNYTEFESRVAGADASSVTVTVKNTGRYSGKETVQLFAAPPQGKLAKPLRILIAFAKTRELAPGEEETLTVPYSVKDMVSYDEENAAYVLEAGDYTVYAGDMPAVTLRLDETAVIRRVKNCLGKTDFTDLEPDEIRSLPASENVVLLRAADLETETVDYNYAPTVLPEVKALLDEELALLNTGAFCPKGGIGSMIGSASQSVAGAAGETARVREFPCVVMADGPAGLRLSKDYTQDEKGARSVTSGIPESVVEFLGRPQQLLLKILSGRKKTPEGVRHQYCTAIPIGTAIAQSFNTALAEALGDIVGDEMERFGINLWLAPALNIHRSVLCGRNFEYYSEDPLVSGKFAAAITRGVQKHPSCGTTIKHFACNNQELNRICSNSMVSERALREIYLRGFEICIKESRPHALMTSYNLLNGIHTSERRDLCTDILRCEWGYEGVVMTDWVIGGIVQNHSSIYRNALSEEVAAAGGALFMPGSKGDYERILKAVRLGKLSRRQLEENASCVMETVRRLKEEKYQ